jgi:hypothetical protein
MRTTLRLFVIVGVASLITGSCFAPHLAETEPATPRASAFAGSGSAHSGMLRSLVDL